VSVVPPMTEFDDSTTADSAAVIVVAAVVESVHPEAATHARIDAAAARTAIDRKQRKPTTVDRRGKRGLCGDRTVSRV
jgi:hypothetical protein